MPRYDGPVGVQRRTKRRTQQFLCLTLALVSVPLAASAPQKKRGRATNLVENGGFEQGLEGWKIEKASAGFEVEIDRKVRAEGKASAHATSRNEGPVAADLLTYELARVPAGKKVLVSALLQGQDLKNCWFKFLVFDARGESIVEACDIGRYTGTFRWKEVEREFDLPEQAVRAELRLCLFLSGEAWLDEVVVLGDVPEPKDREKDDEARKPLEAKTKRWLEQNAIELASLDVDAPFDDLEPLAQVLKEARIVQLGENTHGDGACFEAKLRLIRFLHAELGFEVLAFESGLFECDRANELLRRGDADGALEASVFGIWHVGPVKRLFRYLAEQASSKRPLVLAGFDCRRSGELASRFLERLGEFLAPAGTDERADLLALERLEQLMDAQGDEYRPSEAELAAGQAAWARLRELVDEHRERLAAEHGPAETEFFSRCLDNWRANEEFERSKSDERLGQWGSSNLRDARMAANLRWLAETRHPGKKIITWGATSHLCRGLAGVDPGGDPRFYAAYANMGQGTAAAFGKACYTVGFAAYGGKWGSFGKQIELARPAEGSVEDLLHRFGKPRLFLDLRREGPFSASLRMAPMGYSRTMEAAWPRVLDGLVFLDVMTPAQ
jgi:erythromycin esterase